MGAPGDHDKRCAAWSGSSECTCPQCPESALSATAGAGRQLRLRSLDDVRIAPTHHLWTDYLPVAELTMMVGKRGVGKSTVAADVAAKLTTGHLAGNFLGRPQRVLYSLTEDSESTFKARFLAADGDPGRLHVLDVVHGESDGSPFLVDADLDQLRAAIAELRPALVVLDALNSSLDGQQNENSNIRPQLEKLKALAHRTSTAILGIGHFRKSTAGAEPLDSIGGAGAYGQVIRQALGCARDEEAGGCALSVIKSNGQSLDVASLAYRIEGAAVPSDDGGTASVGRVTWLGESETSVRDLLQRNPRGEEDRSEGKEVADWLIDWLTTNGGEVPTKDVFRAGQSEGYSRDAVKRAKGRRAPGRAAARRGRRPAEGRPVSDRRAEQAGDQDELAAYIARTIARLAETPLTPEQQDVIRAPGRLSPLQDGPTEQGGRGVRGEAPGPMNAGGGSPAPTSPPRTRERGTVDCRRRHRQDGGGGDG
jgi:AAA domain